MSFQRSYYQMHGGERFRAITPPVQVEEILSIQIDQDWQWRFQTSHPEGIRVIVEAIESGSDLSEHRILDRIGAITITLKRPRRIEGRLYSCLRIPISPQYPERHLGQPILDAFLKLKQMKNQGILTNEYSDS